MARHATGANRSPVHTLSRTLRYLSATEVATAQLLLKAIAQEMDYCKTMSNQKTVELILKGNVPSKKNSRINRGDGMSFVSKRYREWQELALYQVRQQTRERFFVPVCIEVIIYFGTKGRADLDNRLTSILDMLVEALVLRDDKWQDVPRMACQAEYRKNAPGAFVRITELDEVL